MRSELIAMSVVSIQEVITQCRKLVSSDYREPLNNTSSDYLPSPSCDKKSPPFLLWKTHFLISQK